MKISMFSSATNGRHVGMKPFFKFDLHDCLRRPLAPEKMNCGTHPAVFQGR
jgi:hypothetical protein